MSRNFYILAAVLGFFALISGGMSLVPSSFQPGLPANGSLWRTVALVLMLLAPRRGSCRRDEPSF